MCRFGSLDGAERRLPMIVMSPSAPLQRKASQITERLKEPADVIVAARPRAADLGAAVGSVLRREEQAPPRGALEAAASDEVSYPVNMIRSC